MKKSKKNVISQFFASCGGVLLLALLAVSFVACSQEMDDDSDTNTSSSVGGVTSLTGSHVDEDGVSDIIDGVYHIYDKDGLKDWGTNYPAYDAIMHVCITWDSTEDDTWTPVKSDENKPYNGIFDGGGHTIAGIEISESGNNVGFFGVIGYGGTVKNLTLEAPIVKSTGAYSVGAVVGRVKSGGKIEYCYVSGGTVESIGTVEETGKTREQIGGIAGTCDGDIAYCTNSATVTGGYSVGGIAGWNSGTVSNCINRGYVTGSDRVGGILGSNYLKKGMSAAVTVCYNYGNVVSSSFVGGIVGYNYSGSAISTCNNYGDYVTGTNYVGGIAGHYCNYGGNLTGCTNAATVTGTNVGNIVGGTKCNDCEKA